MAEVSLEEAPRKARELYDKAYGAMERGNYDYARDMFLAVLDIEPKLLRSRMFLRAAAIRNSKGKKGGGMGHFISSAKGLPGMAKVKAMITKKPLGALKEAEKLLWTDPLNPTFIQLVDDTAVASNMPEVAAMTWQVAKDNGLSNASLLERLGSLYIEVNETHKARLCFEELVRLKPKDQKALKALKDAAALDTMKSGGWEGAGTFRDVIKDTKEAELLEQESKSMKASKGMADLISDAEAKVQKEPANMNYRRSLADLYAREKRFEDALAVLQQAHEESGGADPEVDRAISATRILQYDENIKALTEAGQAEEAAAAEAEKQAFLFTDAKDRVARYPNDLQFKYDLGVLHYERGETNEAVQHLQQAQRNPQRRIRSLYYLALCFKEKQQYDIASEQLEKAASELLVMDDTKKDILYQLGQMAEAMGDPGKALGHYKEIYSVDIGFQDVAEKVEKGLAG